MAPTSTRAKTSTGGTPAGWADYAGHTALRDVILRGPIDIFQAIEFDRTERIPQLLKRDPGALDRRVARPDAAGVCAGQGQRRSGALSQPKPAQRGARRYAAAIETTAGRARRARRAVSRFRLLGSSRPRQGRPSHARPRRPASARAASRDRARQPVHGDRRAASSNRSSACSPSGPTAARERGGSRNWTPLLYLTYTRFTHPPAIEQGRADRPRAARCRRQPERLLHGRRFALLDADGVAREGEQDAPPHPQARGALPAAARARRRSVRHPGALQHALPRRRCCGGSSSIYAHQHAQRDGRATGTIRNGGCSTWADTVRARAICSASPSSKTTSRWRDGCSSTAPARWRRRQSTGVSRSGRCTRTRSRAATPRSRTCSLQYGATPVTPSREGEDVVRRCVSSWRPRRGRVAPPTTSRVSAIAARVVRGGQA